MNYDYNEEQTMVADNFKNFCKKELEPRAQLLDKASKDEVNVLIKENIKKLASIGYLGMLHDEAYGGSNVELVTHVIASEQVAKACASTFLSAGASCGLFGMPLKLFGSEEQKKKYLVPIIKGEIIGAFGLTEPEAGSDAVSMKTTAVKKGDKWIINGAKTFITNAPICDVALIFAYNDKAAGPGGGVTSFLVDRKTKGFNAGKPFEKMGFRGSPTAEIFLEDCEVPESAVLGEVGKGFIQAMKTLEYGRIGMATVCLGIASACLEYSNAYSKERKVFGRFLNRFQEIGFKLADMLIMTDTARNLIFQAAWAKEVNKPDAQILASCAKLFASEHAVKCANMAVQIFGGYGYISEFPVERLYRDAKLGDIGEGTSEIQRILIARDVLSKFA